MLTENLTIYRDTFELCRLMMLYLDSVPRSHRFGEYGRAVSMALDALDMIYVANSSIEERPAALTRYLQIVGGVRSRVRLFTVVKHRPELDCELHGWTHLWRWLHDDKTLFRTKGKGLPIGNLTSQVLANLYMAGFDRWAMERLGENGRYGRYVDDFVLMHKDKGVLLKILSEARYYLRDKLNLKLHPRKTVIQKVCRGMLFTGYFLKGGQIMPGRRMRRNALVVATWWNTKKEHSEGTRRKLMVRMNSYYGMLLHPRAYRIRRKMWFSLQDKKGLVNISMKRINTIRI